MYECKRKLALTWKFLMITRKEKFMKIFSVQNITIHHLPFKIHNDEFYLEGVELKLYISNVTFHYLVKSDLLQKL